MKKKNEPPRNSGMSLMQPNDGRDAMLEKMRGKLAGSSEVHIQAKAQRRIRARKSTFGWAWRIAIVGALAAGNAIWISNRPEGAIIASHRRAPRLPPPAENLSVNEKALYWAYALYDFDQLKAKYGVGKAVVVDARLAASNLQDLLPKVDAKTRFLIERYLPAPKKGW
jgi:hypothetical protein